MKIFNQRLAGYLMMQGFRLVTIKPNTKSNRYNVFEFENSDKLNQTIREYKQNNRNEKEFN